MGRYALKMRFYEQQENSDWHKVFRYIGNERFYHVGLCFNELEIFVSPKKKVGLVESKKLHKLWFPVLDIYLGDYEFKSVNEIEGLIPANFIIRHPLLIVFDIMFFERWLFPIRPKSCFTLVTIMLNKLGIPIPQTSSPNKMRRWLYENNFILWESWNRKDNNCQRVNATSV